MKLALLLALAITTHVRDRVDKYGVYDTSVWRNHEAVGAFTDGVVCYVTADGPSCHRAVPKPNPSMHRSFIGYILLGVLSD